MRPLISTHRGHDRKRNDRRQHDTCTQNEIDDHTGDAHVTTPRCSMIEHASANCRHAASCAIAASRAQAKDGSRLHTSACQHPCMALSAHANKRPARARRHDSAIARERDSAAMNMHTCIWLRPPCPSMHCAAMLIGPKPANDATSSCQVKHTIQSWRVGIMTGSCHDAVAST
jgi:hypothetical protein